MEKAYALGGLATLGLIVIYLPLCDGDGVQMSGGICEEPAQALPGRRAGEIPRALGGALPRGKPGPRPVTRTCNAATLMINAERLLLPESGVDLYDCAWPPSRAMRTGSVRDGGHKAGPMRIAGRAFVDATGDADLCFFAGEPTYSDDGNSRTGWYYSYDGQRARLHMQTDPSPGGSPPTDPTTRATIRRTSPGTWPTCAP